MNESVAGSRQDERSVGQLVHDLTEQTRRLVRTEARLAGRELAVKARRGAQGIGALSVAGVLAAYGGMALLASAILGLSTVLRGWLAALVIGVGLLVIAGMAALAGRSRLRKAMPPAPEDTMARVREDVAYVAGHEERT